MGLAFWTEPRGPVAMSGAYPHGLRTVFLRDDLAVLDPIEPGQDVKLPSAPAFAAGADEAEADALPYTDLQAHVVVEDSDRIDLDVVEHTRQSRLQRWQEQRT